MRKQWLYGFVGVLSFISLWVLPIHSEEQPIRVFINDVEIEEDTDFGSFVKEARIYVQMKDIELSESVAMKLMQDGVEVDSTKYLQKEKDGLLVVLPIGENYTFSIKGVYRGKPQEWHYEKYPFHVRTPIPITINKQPLLDYQVLQGTGTLHMSEQTKIQMNQSYIVLQEKKVFWNKVENGYEYEINETGLYPIEFHFFDLEGKEFIQKHTIVKEYETIQSKFLMNGKVEQGTTQFYKENIILGIQVEVMEVKNLEVYINDKKQDVLWMANEQGFLSEESFKNDGTYHIQLFYREQDNLILLNETNFVLDKVAPVLHMTLDKQAYYQNEVILNIKTKDPDISMSSYIHDEFEDGSIEYSNWTKKDDEFQMQIILSIEGSHKLQFQCWDTSGNKAIVYENDSLIVDDPVFVIDKTPPKIVTNLETLNASSVVQKQNVQCSVKDKYINETDVLVNVYRNQQPYTVEIMKTQLAQETMIEFVLEEDGIYEIEFIATDYANNTSAEHKKIQIDQTKPLLSLSNVHQQITNQDLTLTTQGFDNSIQVYTLVIKRDDKIIKEETFLENFQTVLEFHEDSGTHAYEVSLYGSDKAGNEHQVMSTFILDKDRPVIQPFFQQQPYNTNIITNSPLDVFITWQDSYLESAELLLYKNGELMDQRWLKDAFYKKKTAALASRKDQYQYIVKVYDQAGNMSETTMDITLDTIVPPIEFVKDFQGKSTNQTWTPTLIEIEKDLLIRDVTLFKNQKEIPYVWGTPIEDEGNYQLLISAKDVAGNVGLLEPFHFTIDKTPPSIHILDKQKHQEIDQIYEGSPLELQIHTGFLQKDKIISILLDEKELLHEELSQYDVNIGQGNHQLVIEAIDEAGNKIEKKVDLYVSNYQNSWIKGSICIALLILVLGISFKKIQCFF